MHHYTVTIKNQPLVIQRHFAFTDYYASADFTAWLNSKKLKYTYRYQRHSILPHAVAEVEKELALAADHRVA
jgi:hypothetical protein